MTEPVSQATVETIINEAQQAVAAYRNQESLELTERALKLAGEQVAGRELTARAHAIAAVANFNLGEVRESELALDRAMVLFDELGDERHVAWCEVRCAWCSHERGDLPRALHLASRVLEKARQLGWEDLEAKALLSIGNVAWKRGDRQTALGDLGRAEEIFKRLGMIDAYHRTRGVSGYVRVLDGDPAAGRELLEEAVEYFRRVGDTLYVAKMVSNLAFVHFAAGELPEARELLLRAAELCSPECPQPQLYIVYNLGLIELHLGRLKEARKQLQRARQVAVSLNDPVTEAMSLLYLGVLKIMESNPEEAMELIGLSAKNLAGSSCDETGLIAYYQALGSLATARVEYARVLWSQRLPVSQLRDCLDDFRILERTLDFISSAEYRPPRSISAGTSDQAGAWRDQLRREIMLATR